MRTLGSEIIVTAVAEMCIAANRSLPRDIEQALKDAEKHEEVPAGKEVLRQLVENCNLAKTYNLPLCQDTGIAVFFVELGHELVINGNPLNEAITAGVRQGYKDGLLRKSMCDPFTRANSGDNSPAVIHTKIVPGDKLCIRFMAKGGGSENMSRLVMLPPSAGWQGIKDFVLTTVKQAGANPCPPIIVGLGIGGSFDYAPILAKEALFEALDKINPIDHLADKEHELLEAINALNIGPMGYSMIEKEAVNTTTCLGVRIKSSFCHIASLPVAVNIQCHSSRHAEVIL